MESHLYSYAKYAISYFQVQAEAEEEHEEVVHLLEVKYYLLAFLLSYGILLWKA